MKLEIALQCHNYQRRLCWQLSSFLQQDGDIPEITVNIASLKNNGSPSTEEVIECFRDNHLNIKHTVYSDLYLFAHRGLIRNQQIQESDADWFFFMDADHVYPPLWFNGVYKATAGRFKHTRRILTSFEKYHTDVDATNLIIDNTPDIYIDDVYNKALDIPRIPVVGRRAAGGGTQLVSMEAILDRSGGLYVDPKRCRDKNMLTGTQRALSDKQFRRKFDTCIDIHLGCQVHLNHIRDKELGHHTEEQR